ncbi:uncharacterized protein [Argopecten irradians]|uniref:uncharacterized protein isoform X1 n=1 Tax=Argopecten irradians TaxID=31199 RepID=UPI0037185D16
MGYWTMMFLVGVLTGTVTASTTSYQFKDNCDFRLHTLRRGDTGVVRFSGHRLPGPHCSIGFRGKNNSTTVCMISQPPFTLNGIGPTLTLSQGSGHINSKSYSFLNINSPSRYCTSGGRYLNIALDNANSGSATSRNRGYFTLKVTANYPSSSSNDHVPTIVIVAPAAGGVLFIVMVIVFVGVLRRRRRIN